MGKFAKMILAAKKPMPSPFADPASVDAPAGEADDAGEVASAQAFLDAIKSGDAKALAGAFRSMNTLCAGEPEPEGPAESEPDADVDAVGKGG